MRVGLSLEQGSVRVGRCFVSEVTRDMSAFTVRDGGEF